MKRPKQWAVLVMAGAIAFTLGAATIVVAGGSPPPTVTGNGFDVTRLKVVSSTGGQETGSPTFQDLVGASRSIQLTQSSLVVARFTAESTCFSDGGGSPENSPNGSVNTADPEGPCHVRIIAEKAPSTLVELNPASGTNYTFDTFGCPCDSEGHALERYATLGPGTWNIQVQYAVSGNFAGPNGTNGSSFILDDWSLAVERWSIS